MSTMTGSLPGLPPHSGLILYRMDVDEYESLAGAGVLKDPRVELIDVRSAAATRLEPGTSKTGSGRAS